MRQEASDAGVQMQMHFFRCLDVELPNTWSCTATTQTIIPPVSKIENCKISVRTTALSPPK